MKKIVIFGAADLGQALYERIKNTSEVLYFVDNGHEKPWDLPKDVLPPSKLLEGGFDCVYIASMAGLESIYSQLLNMGIPAHKINRLWGESNLYEHDASIVARIRFLEQFAEYAYYLGIEGSTAECGVYRGEFAREINRVFFDRTLYLFDTFEGFDDKDLINENEINPRFANLQNWINTVQDFTNTSIEIVTQKLPYPDKVIVRKGYFPATFDVGNDKFVFVNLDTDLYAPIKAGLELFYPRMSKGGVILVHDYYSPTGGVHPAVDAFLLENHLVAIPIGDYKSMAIIKN
jgi:hypothetical protein